MNTYISDKINRIAKKNVLFENIFFSIFSHGLNYLFPLITFPYLVRTLGVSEFGSVTFTQNIANYFITIIIFGFHLTGTNEIAQIGENVAEKNRIFHEILFARFALLFICIVILITSVLFVERLHQTPILYFLAFFAVLGWVFQSDFFFQGIQQMKFLSTANFIARLISLIIIFGGVKSQADIYVAVLGYGVGGGMGGVFCFIAAYTKYQLQWYIPTWSAIWSQIVSSYHVFLSAMAVNLYSSSINLLILGFVTNTLFVGYYSIADRVFMLICAIAIPLNQAIFPYLSKLAISDYSKYYRLTKTITIFFIGGFGLLGLLLYSLAPIIVRLISGSPNQQSVEILRILAFCVPMYPLGFTYTNLFIIHRQKKYIVMLNGLLVIINLSLIYPFLHIWGMKGLAFNNLIIFIAMTLIGIYIIKSKNIIQPILIHDER